MPRYPQPGTTLLGKYRVDSLIGEGGMGAVIRARHIELDEEFAIKCLLPEMLDRKDIVARFMRESRAAVRLKGEHVARVFDVGRFENQVPYIVMEYLEGADLNAIVKTHGAQDPGIAVDLILQACEAIAEAHSLGIIHRDIKSSNFFITQPPNQAPLLKVLDFGIATAPEGTSDLTSTQSVIGTPAYMAPEQMRSSRTADVRSDIWSIGVVLYELLEGTRPFRSDAYSELVLKVGMDPPHEFEHPVSEGLRAVVMKCLEKPVEKRYQTVAELAFDLVPFAGDPVAARASLEQCARLLGRRGSKAFETPKIDSGPVHIDFDSESDPANRVVPRLTPRSAQHAIPYEAMPKTPTSSSELRAKLDSSPAIPQVLGRPTPHPQPGTRTPTSVNASKGEIHTPVPTAPKLQRGRGRIVAFLSMAILVVGGAAFYVMRTTADVDVVPAAGPPPPTPVVVKPAETKPEPEPPKPANPANPANVDEPKPDPVAADPLPPPEVKKPPARVIAKKQTPIVKKLPPPTTPKKDEPGGELFKKRQ